MTGVEGSPTLRHTVAGYGMGTTAANMAMTVVGPTDILVVDPRGFALLEGMETTYTVRLARVPGVRPLSATTSGLPAGGNFQARRYSIRSDASNWAAAQPVTIFQSQEDERLSRPVANLPQSDGRLERDTNHAGAGAGDPGHGADPGGGGGSDGAGGAGGERTVGGGGSDGAGGAAAGGAAKLSVSPSGGRCERAAAVHADAGAADVRGDDAAAAGNGPYFGMPRAWGMRIRPAGSRAP